MSHWVESVHQSIPFKHWRVVRNSFCFTHQKKAHCRASPRINDLLTSLVSNPILTKGWRKLEVRYPNFITTSMKVWMEADDLESGRECNKMKAGLSISIDIGLAKFIFWIKSTDPSLCFCFVLYKLTLPSGLHFPGFLAKWLLAKVWSMGSPGRGRKEWSQHISPLLYLLCVVLASLPLSLWFHLLLKSCDPLGSEKTTSTHL